jgi:hypothetical protein
VQSGFLTTVTGLNQGTAATFLEAWLPSRWRWVPLLLGLISSLIPGNLLVAAPLWSPVAEPERSHLLRQVQRASQQMPLCETRHTPNYAEAVSPVYRRGDRPQTFLVLYHCFLGAYQPSIELYLLENKTLVPLGLPVYLDQSPPQRITTHQFGGSLTLTSEGSLELLEQCRGLGDCGLYGRYQWQDEGFRLIEFRSRLRTTDRDMDLEPHPQNWPRLYPSVDRS